MLEQLFHRTCETEFKYSSRPVLKELFEILSQEMNDAVDDSDDEVDYTKMDLGNKKVTMGISFYFLKDLQ